LTVIVSENLSMRSSASRSVPMGFVFLDGSARPRQ
jgi:hypothetical protein